MSELLKLVSQKDEVQNISKVFEHETYSLFRTVSKNFFN